MGLREIELTLPPGFRFYPSDEELVCHYLHKKVANERGSQGTMVEVDLHTREPWDLPDVAKLSANEWYFFSFRDRKYATGSRTNRATRSGYWKATGKDRTVYDPVTGCDVVGMRKTLVFYGGRAPNGVKTDWVMHEFRLESPHSAQKEADWVLCRVFSKKKGDPTNRTSFENNRDDRISSGSRNKTNDEDVIFGGGGGSSSNSLLNLAVLHYNLVGFPIPQEVEDDARMVDVGSCKLGAGDDYEVMLDMSTEDMQELFGLGVANLAAGGISFHDTNDNVFF